MRVRTSPLFALLWSLSAAAADSGGYLAGTASGPHGRPLQAVEVRIQNQNTGARITLVTASEGRYASGVLSPGLYKLTARQTGLRTVTRPDIEVRANETALVDFLLEIVPLGQSVTVESRNGEFDTVSPGLTIRREGPGSEIPSNGHDLHAFFDLAPGSVDTPAVAGEGGQFSVNGQRPNTNAFRVDGLSANSGVGSSILPGAYPGSSLPGMTAIGGTENLASREEMDQIEFRASDFSPESGDRPGAQILVTTRPGSEEYHGALFGSWRPAALGAHDWIANSRGVPLAPSSVWNTGLSAGGRVFGRRTFFFLSLEYKSVADQVARIAAVPSPEARQNAAAAWAPIVRAFPAPAGTLLSANESETLIALRNQAGIPRGGLRMDHAFGASNAAFFRMTAAPSSVTTDEVTRFSGHYQWLSAAGGVILPRGSGALHEARFQYTAASVASDSLQIPRYGVEPLRISQFRPVEDTAQHVVEGFFVPGIGQITLGQTGEARQTEWELVYRYGRISGHRQWRVGADYIQLTPRRPSPVEAISLTPASLDALVSGNPVRVTNFDVQAQTARIRVLSLFAQESIALTPRLNLLYGVRWEITPPVNSNSLTPLTIGNWEGLGTPFPVTAAGNSESVVNWPADYRQFAPRAGLAWRVPWIETVVRAGAGVFYDTDLGAAVNPVNGAPFNSWPSLNSGATVGGSQAETATLKLPMSVEWRLSLERSLGSQSNFSMSYLGTAGKHLLRREALSGVSPGVMTQILATSFGASGYQALQAHASGRLFSRFEGIVSYTWAHSIDNGSRDSDVFLVYSGYRRAGDRASSDFDVRHMAVGSLTARLPANWSVSGSVRLRSGFPIDPASVDRALGFDFRNAGRLDRVPDVAEWLADSNAPGGRRLNPGSFTVPIGLAGGALARNAVRGFGLTQVDASLHRPIRLGRGISAEFTLTAINLFNHPAFADPVAYRLSPLFGLSGSVQSLMLGEGGPNTGLTPVFQNGGPRTVEAGFRVQF